MSTVLHSDIHNGRDHVSAEEWEVRVDLAAVYRLVAMFGWDDLIFTHISARVPGTEHHFLINPYGWMFEEITASSLVKIDLQGHKVMDSPYDINPAGFTIHSAIHAAREDAYASCTRTRSTASRCPRRRMACCRCRRPRSSPAAPWLPRLRRHRAVRGREAAPCRRPRRQDDDDAAQPRFADHRCRLRRGVHAHVLPRGRMHDPGTCAGRRRSVARRAATVLDHIDEQVDMATRGQFGSLAWPGLLRKLDRHNPGYRD